MKQAGAELNPDPSKSPELTINSFQGGGVIIRPRAYSVQVVISFALFTIFTVKYHRASLSKVNKNV